MRAFCRGALGPHRHWRDAREIFVSIKRSEEVRLGRIFLGIKRLGGCFGRLTGRAGRGFCVRLRAAYTGDVACLNFTSEGSAIVDLGETSEPPGM